MRITDAYIIEREKVETLIKKYVDATHRYYTTENKKQEIKELERSIAYENILNLLGIETKEFVKHTDNKTALVAIWVDGETYKFNEE